MKKKDKHTQIALKLLIQELEENPYKKFNIAFALMVIIPFLVFLYLLAGRFFSFAVLAGNTGLVIFLTFFISVAGFLIGYNILKNIMNKIIFYAAHAKHSDKLKSSFVATVSHELKNPLSSIKINLFNMHSGFVGQISQEQKQIIILCQNTIERMDRLISDLLDLHKIESGVVDINRKLCNLIQISDKQIKELESLIHARGLKVTRQFIDKELAVWGDEDKLSRVINNLLSNAIKFTPAGGSVTLKLYADEEFSKIECIDTGPGIPEKDIDRLFNKFERLNITEEGSGLGLAISKDIIELHKGNIWVESRLGVGTKFIVALPNDLRKIAR